MIKWTRVRQNYDYSYSAYDGYGYRRYSGYRQTCSMYRCSAYAVWRTNLSLGGSTMKLFACNKHKEKFEE